MQKRIRSKKTQSQRKLRAAGGTSQLLQKEKPRREGAEAYKAQARPRARNG